ncbi:MAG: dTDP-4-dehydrorhamnose 3,5-epimerase [Crocinitomicaceae bacterium]|nr:dTDP-4-dehydrorhamnose 3,5-epimerase [Crocinitomicaceae bacterium]MDG1775974.1 dTDP-4-dehydrorhamnose 3,5-epimerase [Crocinitomicaceae bacterium]
MKITKTPIHDLVILEPKVFGDDRGYFMESFQEDWFIENVSNTKFIQDNESKSSKGVLRGLHFQKPPFEQAKLVRVIQGEVLDVAVDLRKNSPTYGKHYSILLTAENKKQFFVPRGFAHGFVVLSETAIFSYKVDNLYSPSHDSGLAWNDSDLNIDWNIDESMIQLSEKDKLQGTLNDFTTPFS